MAAATSSSTPPSDTVSRFQLPGLNLPLHWEPSRLGPRQGRLFFTALNRDDVWDEYTMLRLTPLREFTMLHIMDALTDKPGWEEKIFDDEIAEKWKAEAMTAVGRDVTQEMADWVVAELRYKAKDFKAIGAISVYDGDVVKSDTAVPIELKEALQAAVEDLENAVEFSKDYHPGSDGKVLDLVHPSLFPLIYGRTRVLSDSLIGLDDCIESCGKGKVAPIRADDDLHHFSRHPEPSSASGWHINSMPGAYSKNFQASLALQWLPSEVEFSKEDGTVKFASYINNLHPTKYTRLYSIIEKIIDRAIPLWNKTLFPLNMHNRLEYDVCRIPYTSQEFDPDPEKMPEEEKPQREDSESEDAYWERLEEWERAVRRVVLPNPGEFEPPKPIEAEDMIDLKRDFAHRGLQIVVKLANIELTPEKPTYEGGVWHVEGQLNEHLCATALYYLSNSNISSSRLSFKQHCSFDPMDVYYGQDEHDFLRAVYGCESEGPRVQEVGSVACREGRLLTFPNILQHRVLPFSLADPTKPGHRKILALFLVDPHIRIISTANVPPQRRDWWSEAILQDFSGQKRDHAFGKLSQEICDQVFESVNDFPIGMDEAKEIRLSLMEERKQYVSYFDASFNSETFSLCEH